MPVIDYSTYTLEELLDVKENIDSMTYPERYQRLLAEIKIKQKIKVKTVKDEPEVDDWSFYWRNRQFSIIIEFDKSAPTKRWRMGFILFMFFVNAAVLTWILPDYVVTELKELHQYTTEIDTVECRQDTVIDEETDKVSYFYDIVINVYPVIFIAPNFSPQMCKYVAQEISKKQRVSIWQEDGLIHQLSSNNELILSYKFMRPKVKDFRTRNSIIYLIFLAMFNLIFFKSIINALTPGSFKSFDFT
ncbi:hypothetical protein Q4591_03055 [Shewanella sp. 3_MG-2023]|uniref:hypothetical protein n=1 Tax=Shewanella sp. 3_MG-2023 TaxID=3062635 RepID=UPI0026E3D12A|nr:hypothetical protein [Shewanella sp. 3_MG-2023]MDO6774320.1 hypothetical protein [Shewanella sp. 3_MG-2023]